MTTFREVQLAELNGDVPLQDQQRWSPWSFHAFACAFLDIANVWSARAVIVDTSEYADRLSAMSRRSRDAFIVIPPFPVVGSAAWRLRSEDGWSPTAGVLWAGSSGRFAGVETIRQAMWQLSASGFQPSVTMVSNQPLGDLPRFVTTHGAMEAPSLAAEIRRTRLVLGAFGGSAKFDRVVPYKVLDAMAAGRPVVTGRSKAAVRVIGQGHGVKFVSPGNSTDLADAVRELLLDAEGLEAAGIAARRRFEEIFGDGPRAQWASELRAG